MQFEDPNFFYALQVDVEDLITNILWVDSQMKLDYECFGDVVCFDTTYRKNKEGRPFAMFVGVNHHKQSIIFGAALLYDETTETFMWLFDSFVNAMSGEKPKTILTDEDAAMAKALSLKWPETYHRLCVWHIYQNAAKHLSHVFEKFKTFAKDFSSCVYDHDQEEDFLNAWHMILDKYSLQDNTWLQKRFELREKWALVYGRRTFCADMSTTQRSESMNSQIKQYIGYNYDLRRFFAHFQRLLDGIRFNELKADFKTLSSKPHLPCKVEILRNAAKVYTPEVFKLFSKQLWLTWDCEMYSLEEEDGMTRYKVVPQKKSCHHIVAFDGSNSIITCSCKKFEFVGILCAHALKVLSFHNIKRLPDQYILKRWTKDAKKNVSHLLPPPKTNDLKIDMAARYKILLKSYAHLAVRAALSEDTFDLAILNREVTLNEVEVKLEKARVEEDNNGSLCLIETMCQDDPNNVKGIKCKKKKDQVGSSKRKKNALEKATRKKKHQSIEEPLNEGQEYEISKAAHKQISCEVGTFLSSQTSNENDIQIVQPTQVLQGINFMASCSATDGFTSLTHPSFPLNMPNYFGQCVSSMGLNSSSMLDLLKAQELPPQDPQN